MPQDSRHWAPPAWARALRAVLALSLVTYAATFLPGVRGDGPPFSAPLDIGLGDGIQVLAGITCLARAWWDPKHRLAWSLLGAGPLAYAAGDLYYYAALQSHADIPYPSLGDVGWLAMYPLVNVGLVLLVRAQLVRVRTSLWLDGLTGGTGAAALVGAAVLRPVLEMTGGGLPVILTNLAYPIGDLALLTILILVFNLHGWRPGRSWWLLGFAPATLLVVDSIYLLQVSSSTYVDGALLDLGWPVAFCALGLAAWTRPPALRAVREGAASLAVPATLSVCSTGVLFWGAVQTLPIVVCLLGLAAVLLASVRLLVALVETRRLVEARLEARTDELTGLPNRRKFLEEIARRLDDAPTPLTVMIVDLDRFKQVNDSLGHPVGDALLNIVGNRLREQCSSDTTFVARLGGDEFAVLVDGDDPVTARQVGELVREVIAQPVVLSGLALSIDASIGVSFSPAQGITWDAVMSRADAAMYVAKNTHTGVELYVENRDEGGIDRLALLAELRTALAARELVLHYQLVHRVSDTRVTSAEALIRWQHPTRGALSPADFLPVAIEAGLSRALTDEVLRMATEQSASWLSLGLEVAIAVNLTEADLADGFLVDRVTAACEAVGLPPRLLRLEVTESITAAVANAATVTLNALRARGHQLLLDDFGTGFSSLSFLRDLPLDEVKLDRSFLVDLHEPSATAMVRATIELAHQIGLTIVAEGVETEAALEVLRDLGCDSVQGFLLHRPAPGDDVTERLRANAAVLA
jgi:diguanylate cyclase (GGDEF)-like protein